MEKDELSIARQKLSIVSSKLSLNSSVNVNETSKNTESAPTNTRVMLSPEPDHRQTVKNDKSPLECIDEIIQRIVSSKLSPNSSVNVLDSETSKNTESAPTNTRVLLSELDHMRQTVMDDKSPLECKDEIIRSAFFDKSNVICVSNNGGKHSDTNYTITISDSDDDFDKDKTNSNKESDKIKPSISSASDVFKGNENDRKPDNPNVHQPIPFLEPETSNKDPPSTTTPNINMAILEDLLKDIKENKGNIPTFNHPLHQPRVTKVNNYEQLTKNRLSSVNNKNNTCDMRSNETVLQTSNILTEINSKNMATGLIAGKNNCAPTPAAGSCPKRENSESIDTLTLANFQPNMHKSANTQSAVSHRISETIAETCARSRYNKHINSYNSIDQSQHLHHNADNTHIFKKNLLNSDNFKKTGQTCHDRISPLSKWNASVAAIMPVNTQLCARPCYPLVPYKNNFDLDCTPHTTMSGDIGVQSSQPVTRIPELSLSDNLVTPNRSSSLLDDYIEAKIMAITNFNPYNKCRPVPSPISRRQGSSYRSGKSRYHLSYGGCEYAGVENDYQRTVFGKMRDTLTEDRVQRARSRPPEGGSHFISRSNLEERHEGGVEHRIRRTASLDRNLAHINMKNSITNHRLERTLSSSPLPKNKNVEKEIQVEKEKGSLNSQPKEKQKNLNEDTDKFKVKLESSCKTINDNEITTSSIKTTIQTKHKQLPASAVLSEYKFNETESECVTHPESKHSKKVEKIQTKKLNNNKSKVNNKAFLESYTGSVKKHKKNNISLSSQTKKKLTKKPYNPKSNQNPSKYILDKYQREILIPPEKITEVNTCKTTRKKTTILTKLKQLPCMSSKNGITENHLEKNKSTEENKNKSKGIYKKSKTTVLTKKVIETKTMNKKKTFSPALTRTEINEKKSTPKVRKRYKRIIYSDSDSDAMPENNNVTGSSKGENVSASAINGELLKSPGVGEESPDVKIKKSKIRIIAYSDSDSENLQKTVKDSNKKSSDRGVVFKITDNLNGKINTPNMVKSTRGNVSSDIGVPIKKNEERNSNCDKTKNTDSIKDQDLCITTKVVKKEMNEGGDLSISNESYNLENAILYGNKEQNLEKRLSAAWRLLKDIPKSILLSFIADLCNQREKEEIAEVIKCLNNIVSDDNEDNVQRCIEVKAKRKRGRPPKRKPNNSDINGGVCNSENKNSRSIKSGSISYGSYLSTTDINKNQLDSIFEEVSYSKNKQSGSTKSGSMTDGTSSLSTTDTDKHQLDSICEYENKGKFITGVYPQSDDVSTENVNAGIQIINDSKDNSEDLHVITFENNFDSHFKICNGDNGAEYICCINGNQNHFKSKLKVQMKKHVVAEHPETWNGYCTFCKKNISLDGRFSFKDCFEHMFNYHLEDLPTIDTKQQYTSGDVSNRNYQFDKTTEETDALRADRAGVNGMKQNIIDQTKRPSPHKQHEISNTITATIGIKNTIKTELKGTIEKEGLIFSAKESCTQTSAQKTTELEFEMVYKYEEHQNYIMKSKHSSVKITMLSEEKLMQIYKCAGRFCAYTTNSLDLAKHHITAHQGARVKTENVLMCAYCNFNCKNNIGALVKHVFETHGRCRYACNQCFYRAAASQLVLSHIHKVHPKALERILEAPSSDCRHEEESLPQHIKIQRYYCNNKSLTPECKRSYFSQGSFIRHLQNHDAPYLCYICNHASNEPDKLLKHMSDHGLKKYHCTWCSEGGDTEQQFMAHFSARHPTRQPQAYLRKFDGMQEDKSQIIVLPLVELNKSLVTTYVVTPSGTEYDPVVEANKAHNLEELIESVTKEDREVNLSKLPSTSVEAKHKFQKTTSEDNNIKQVIKRKLPECAGPERIYYKRARSSEQDLRKQFQVIKRDKVQCETDTKNTVALPVLPKAETQYSKYAQERLYTCGAKNCTLAFEREDHLQFHWNVYHREKNEFFCVHCQKKFNFVSWDDISNHLNFHVNQRYIYRYLKRHIDVVHKGVGELITVRDEDVKERDILKEDSSSKGDITEDIGATVKTNKSYKVEEISPICIRLTATAEPREKPRVTT